MRARLPGLHRADPSTPLDERYSVVSDRDKSTAALPRGDDPPRPPRFLGDPSPQTPPPPPPDPPAVRPGVPPRLGGLPGLQRGVRRRPGRRGPRRRRAARRGTDRRDPRAGPGLPPEPDAPAAAGKAG